METRCVCARSIGLCGANEGEENYGDECHIVNRNASRANVSAKMFVFQLIIDPNVIVFLHIFFVLLCIAIP